MDFCLYQCLLLLSELESLPTQCSSYFGRDYSQQVCKESFLCYYAFHSFHRRLLLHRKKHSQQRKIWFAPIHTFVLVATQHHEMVMDYHHCHHWMMMTLCPDICLPFPIVSQRMMAMAMKPLMMLFGLATTSHGCECMLQRNGSKGCSFESSLLILRGH